MGAAILRPRTLVMTLVERSLLPVGNDLNARGPDPGGDQIVARRFRALLAERLVVLHGSALVAVALDRDVDARVVPQEPGVLVERRTGVIAERIRIEVEE